MKNPEKMSGVIWQAQEYHDLSIAQYTAAINMLKRLQISEKDNILDIGCGSGRISAEIAEMIISGTILAIDKSGEMIQFAKDRFPKKNHPNLRFRVQDVQKVDYKDKFDLVFSCFALQWIEDKNIFFQKVYQSLKKNGRLAIIVPLGISPELEQAINSVIILSKWHSYYQSFNPNWFFSTSHTIEYLAKENNFRVNHFSTCIQEVSFPTREAFETYVLLWFVYLMPLPEKLKRIFFEEVLEEYFKELPIEPDGSVLLKIPRLDLIADKA